MADNRCVCCGEIIPEGMIACPNCLVVSKRKDPVEKKIAEVDSSFIRKAVFVQPEYATPCLICGEAIPVSFGHHYPQICKKCKDAVMKVREQDGNS